MILLKILFLLVVLREKQRKVVEDNELLKTRLREINETIIKSDGQQNSVVRELKLATDQSDRYLDQMGKLTTRVSLDYGLKQAKESGQVFHEGFFNMADKSI